MALSCKMSVVKTYVKWYTLLIYASTLRNNKFIMMTGGWRGQIYSYGFVCVQY